MVAMYRLTVVACTVSLFVAACGGDGAKAAPNAVDVVVAPVQVRDVPIVVEWAAQTSGANDVEIRARVKGFLTSKAYKEGSPVKRGDLMFQIDPSEYQAAVAQARAGLSESQANLSKASTDVARLRPLAERNAVSRQDLDHAVAAQQAAEGQVAAARAVMNTAQLNLGYTKVTSPISGLAGVAQADVGSLVGSPGPTLLTVVSQVDTLKVKFRISEQEYLLLRRALGDSAPRAARREGRLELVLADGSVFDHKGTVVTVDRNIDPATGTLGIEALFPNPTGFLRPGQFGRVRAPVTTRTNAILVPQRAVREMQGTFSVGVLKPDSTVEVRPVKAGARVGSDWVVDSGLVAGTVIVVEGMQKVRPGVKVRATRGAATADTARVSQASDTSARH
ncbi:MAG TPA: efflux RND transporter periplasmic adaptor subunit [Gemmatimonadales bacterium]|nr:efflux RND transporter periplasmic adaptor subunit [Gemmatimonadales bacterium]